MEQAHHRRPRVLGRPGRAGSATTPAYLIVIVSIVLALVAAGCTSDEPDSEPSSSDTITTTSRGGDGSILEATVAAGDGTDGDSTSTSDPSTTGDDNDDDDGHCGPSRATEIRFQAGDSSTTIAVAASTGQRDLYTLDVNAGQIMTIRIDSADTTARATLLTPGSNVTTPGFVEQPVVPTRAGTYEICVDTGSNGSDYELFVSIIDDNTPTRIDAPWCGETVNDRGEIRFEPGRFSDSLEGGVLRDEHDLYTLDTEAGQDIDLFLVSVEDNARFDLRAPSGELVMDDVSDFRLPLPETGTYQICVGSIRGNTSYVLEVAIA